MKRRSFLRALGATVAAPLLPVAGSAAAYSRGTYGLALAHAKKYPFVSVRGMTTRLGVTGAQAEALLAEMSSKGVLGGINASYNGAGLATSKVFVKPVIAPAKTAQSGARNTRKPMQAAETHTPVDVRPACLDLMLMHLRTM